MGSATAYQLAKRGKRVLGLEQYGIPHTMGSSHGHTRIIRMAYYEHPSYVHLLRRAYELWREIQREANEKLLYTTGSIDAGPEDSWVFKGSWESCKQHDLSHEVLTGAELQPPPSRLQVTRRPPRAFAARRRVPRTGAVHRLLRHGRAGPRRRDPRPTKRSWEWEPLDGGVRGAHQSWNL